MANEFARNITDATYSTTFTLPASASASTQQSSGFDLGADTYKPENLEMELSVPALSSTIVPDTRTVTYIIESSTTSNFAAISQTIYTWTFTGASSAGVGAQVIRVRIPSNCARYVRSKVTFGASTTDGSALSATSRLLF